jgi:CSLREA domain-containing protein
VIRPQQGIADKGAFEFTFIPSLVVTTFVDENNGTSDARFGSGTSLREAIFFANEKAGENVITFDDQVFAGPQTITLSSALPTVEGNLTIFGPSAGVTVTGRVGPANALFSVASGARTRVAFLNFSGSKTGVRNAGTLVLLAVGLSKSTTNLDNTGTATLTLSIVGQSSTGIQNSGTLSVNTTRFAGNTSALVNSEGATATVTASTLSGNGTGVLSNGTLTLRSSTLTSNGEGVRSQSGSTAISQSTFVSNTVAVVGASGVTLLVNRSTISGNGTGLDTGGASTTLRNTLLVGNSTNLSGTATRAFNLLNASAAQAGLGNRWQRGAVAQGQRWPNPYGGSCARFTGDQQGRPRHQPGLRPTRRTVHPQRGRTC